ncbi:MAG: T9SS type A sorting domain-containing protein [Brumimicrobium sp.]|nr:T9SS type A sorting domain-containing protein [Brumimicrobium sp.]
MRLFIIIVYLMCFGQIIAQGAFYYKHIQPYSNQSFSVAESKNGFLIVGQNAVQGGESNGFLMKIDKQGNVIWDKIVNAPEPDKYENYRAVVYHDGYFYVGGLRRIEGNQHNLILKVDSNNGDIIGDYMFGNDKVLANDNLIGDIKLNSEGLLIATSGFDSTSMSTVAELIQLDFQANVLWKKIYSADLNTSHFSDRMTKIEPMDDGFLLKMNSLDVPLWQTNHFIIRTDLNGNEIWRKNMRNYQSSSTGSDSLLWFADATPFKKKNVIAHFVIDNITDSTYTQNIVVVEFDENGNEIFYKKYPEKTEGIGPSDIFSDNDNNIYILGGQEVSPPYYSQLYAAKLNPEKEFLWENHYGEKDITELYIHSLLTSDGGVLIGGRDLLYEVSNNRYYSILVKTDCEGNTEWNYESCRSPSFDDITIFPNPSSDNFIVQIPTIPEHSVIRLEVYDMMGKLVSRNEYIDKEVLKINSSTWNSGVYHCIFYVDNEYFKSKKIIKN